MGAIQRLRETIGYEVSLGAQAFGYQTAESAIKVGEFLAQAPYSLAFMEEMVSFTRFNSVNLNRRIASGSPTPNQAGENIFGFEAFAPFIEAGALDIIHPLPEGPGLGIEFNEEVAEKYLMEPEYLPFDPGLFEPIPEEFDRPMLLFEAKEKGLIDYERDYGYSWWHLDENLDYGYKPRGS